MIMMLAIAVFGATLGVASYAIAGTVAGRPFATGNDAGGNAGARHAPASGQAPGGVGAAAAGCTPDCPVARSRLTRL